MEEKALMKYSVQLSFEEIGLPPFEDILVLGKKCDQGKIGVNKSFEFLIPNEFEMFEIDDENVEAVFINKKILKKMDDNRIIKVLQHKVFPYIADNEILKVNFKLKIFYEAIEGEL